MDWIPEFIHPYHLWFNRFLLFQQGKGIGKQFFHTIKFRVILIV